MIYHRDEAATDGLPGIVLSLDNVRCERNNFSAVAELEMHLTTA